MQDKILTECQSDEKWGKTEYFEAHSLALPKSFDWRKSNCDEKRSCPCKLLVEDESSILH